MMTMVKRYLSGVPIFGSLFTISLRAQAEATVELIITLIFSTLPIWFGGLILSINNFFANYKDESNEKISFISVYINNIVGSVSNGELLMYAAATLGPTLYLGLSTFGRKEKPFPWVRPQLIIAIIINFFATVLFFMARDKGYSGEKVFVYLTFIPYILSIFLLFPAMAFEQDRRADPLQAQREDQEEFVAGYKRHRG